MIYCDGCGYRKNSWSSYWGYDTKGIHKALVVAGSISNAQQRTMKFETSGTFSYHPEMQSDIVINVGKKALLSFLYNEDRPTLALDTWRGRNDTARLSQQMTTHEYTFNVLALDEATDKEIQRRGAEKLYGTPVYVISKGSIALRDYDPDGSVVLFDIPRIS